eukprot:13466591-Ditylum_brightwellii.AAC.1
MFNSLTSLLEIKVCQLKAAKLQRAVYDFSGSITVEAQLWKDCPYTWCHEAETRCFGERCDSHQ